jgi:hypothetical protein
MLSAPPCRPGGSGERGRRAGRGREARRSALPVLWVWFARGWAWRGSTKPGVGRPGPGTQALLLGARARGRQAPGRRERAAVKLETLRAPRRAPLRRGRRRAPRKSKRRAAGAQRRRRPRRRADGLPPAFHGRPIPRRVLWRGVGGWGRRGACGAHPKAAAAARGHKIVRCAPSFPMPRSYNTTPPLTFSPCHRGSHELLARTREGGRLGARGRGILLRASGVVACCTRAARDSHPVCWVSVRQEGATGAPAGRIKTPRHPPVAPGPQRPAPRPTYPPPPPPALPCPALPCPALPCPALPCAPPEPPPPAPCPQRPPRPAAGTPSPAQSLLRWAGATRPRAAAGASRAPPPRRRVWWRARGTPARGAAQGRAPRAAQRELGPERR